MKKVLNLIVFSFFISFLFFNSCEKENVIDKPDEKKDTITTPKDSVDTQDSVVTPEFPELDNSIFLNKFGTAKRLAKILSKTDPNNLLVKGSVEISDEQIKEIKEFTDKLVAKSKNNTEKYSTIFKWVTANIKYKPADNRAYTVFKERKGICQGFSNLFKIMLLTQNIPALITNGTYVGVGGHAWTYVYLDGQWVVSDPTNKRGYKMEKMSLYKHLSPQRIDIIAFSDDNFDYTFYANQLAVVKVKKADSENLVLPVSVSGFRVTEFNPIVALPNKIKNIYLGKNIVSLGIDYSLGLQFHGENIEAIYVDPENKEFQTSNKIIYKKKNLQMPYHIPAKLKKIELLPIETVGKNTIYHHSDVIEIVFAKGTKKIEAYAVEDCPKLEKVYVPKDTQIDKDAFYKVNDIEIIRTEE